MENFPIRGPLYQGVEAHLSRFAGARIVSTMPPMPCFKRWYVPSIQSGGSMKKFFALVSCLVLAQSMAFAETIPATEIEEMEITTEHEAEEEANLTIKEVKALVATLPAESTCMDDYLKRRTQLITKLALTPVTAVAGVMGSAYAGGAAALGAATVLGVRGWSALGYLIVGAGAGGAISSAYILYDGTKSTLDMIDNNLMLKALAEQHLNVSGPKTEKLYQKYVKKNAGEDLTKEEFAAKLLELDTSGALCDASMVKQPKFKVGFKLKYKLAKSKDLIKSL